MDQSQWIERSLHLRARLLLRNTIVQEANTLTDDQVATFNSWFSNYCDVCCRVGITIQVPQRPPPPHFSNAQLHRFVLLMEILLDYASQSPMIYALLKEFTLILHTILSWRGPNGNLIGIINECLPSFEQLKDTAEQNNETSNQQYGEEVANTDVDSAQNNVTEEHGEVEEYEIEDSWVEETEDNKGATHEQLEQLMTVSPRDKICAICLMEYEEEEKTMQFPCKHDFHKQCTIEWLKNKVTCPLCRSELP